ncbi:MAG: ComF family protein [Candidatus Magasanikbacteria bacterium]|nr:ComF family protein [Candidatus Magasanikbacteria bacterium]
MKKSLDGLKKIYRRVADAAADILFPLTCLGCGKEGVIACMPCAASVSFAPVCACPWCGKVSKEGRPCGLCADAVGVKSVVGSFDYHVPLIAQLIKAWKYHGMTASGTEIGRLLGEWIDHEPWVRAWSANAVLAPIPLHRRRLCERGFNQAECLARVWARLLNLSVVDCLKRIVYTEAQAQQARFDRQKLSTHVFAMKRGIVLGVQKVILIDDVYTTGTTLNLAAQTLHAAGVAEVYGLVCARET